MVGLLIENQLHKKSNPHYTYGIMPKHNTSGGAHLCAYATQFRIPPKKQRRNGGELPTLIALFLTSTLNGW